MSDQEKREQEIMNQEMSTDEMETVAGGRLSDDCRGTENTSCFTGHWEDVCDWSISSKYGRPFRRPDGSVNCAATVEDGSWCDSNDACYRNEINYMSLEDCSKAWQ